MRIHGIMLVKDEADVVGEVVEAALGWIDAIYVFDNGSTDGTWELIHELASRDARVVPFKQDPRPFSQSIRGEVFRAFRRRADAGDWWCILDADEIYIDDPRAFLGRVPARHGEVWSASYQYYFTDEDARRYEEDPRGFLRMPVRERIRYYQNNWSESRFFRHHRGLIWPEDHGEHVYRRPLGRLPVYPHRIRLKHYQYRSPEQIEARLRSRLGVSGSYRHEQDANWGAELLGADAVAARRARGGPPCWLDRVVPAAMLHYDRGDGHYVPNPAVLPPLPRDRYGLRRAKQQLESVWWRLHAAQRAGAA